MINEREPITQKPWTLLAILLFFGIALAFWWHRPLLDLMPPCTFRKFTNLQCPGCGGRRCVTLLAKGQVIQALHMNALIIGLGLTCAVILLRQCLHEWITGKAAHWTLSVRGSWILIGSIIAFWVLRNVPYWPFTLLAPL